MLSLALALVALADLLVAVAFLAEADFLAALAPLADAALASAVPPSLPSPALRSRSSRVLSTSPVVPDSATAFDRAPELPMLSALPPAAVLPVPPDDPPSLLAAVALEVESGW